MSYTEFIYRQRPDYDREIKVNGETLKAFSRKALKKQCPDMALAGETFEAKKRNRNKDIGRVELNEKRLNVAAAGTYGRVFRRAYAFVETDGGFLALLKLRLLPFILIFGILLGAAAGAVLCMGNTQDPTDGMDPGIRPVETVILTVSGTVTKDGNALEGATLSLQKGNTEIAAATTDKDGKYLFGDVKNGDYNLVCTYGNSLLTKIAAVNGMSVVVDFRFPADDLHDVQDITGKTENLPDSKPTEDTSDVKAKVIVPDDGTPDIAVGGLDTEAMLHMIAGREVDLTLTAKMVLPPENSGIPAMAGELTLEYFDFSLRKEVFKNQQLLSSEALGTAKTVLEIAVPYDSRSAVATYVLRDGFGRFTRLTEKPAGDYTEGTFYVTADAVYIYTSQMGSYAIGSAFTDHIVKGGDTITYSDTATVNLKTEKISMLYMHDADSTNEARIELYLVGSSGNLLIASSGRIPVGYMLDTMTLGSGIAGMPSVGTYNGLMKIIYLGSGGDTDTNVDIPLSVAITQ